MNGESERIANGWTVDTYAAHNEALRAAEEKFQEERDRRYAEVDIEKEKALKIKETADLAALSLARDIQIYKDEKANELREQINSERGLYATKADITSLSEKFEAALKPLAEYVTGSRGRDQGIGLGWQTLVTALAIVIAVATYLTNH